MKNLDWIEVCKKSSIPEDWQIQIVVHSHKKEHIRDCNNNRSTTLRYAQNLYERIIVRRIKQCMELTLEKDKVGSGKKKRSAPYIQGNNSNTNKDNTK